MPGPIRPRPTDPKPLEIATMSFTNTLRASALAASLAMKWQMIVTARHWAKYVTCDPDAVCERVCNS